MRSLRLVSRVRRLPAGVRVRPCLLCTAPPQQPAPPSSQPPSEMTTTKAYRLRVESQELLRDVMEQGTQLHLATADEFVFPTKMFKEPAVPIIPLYARKYRGTKASVAYRRAGLVPTVLQGGYEPSMLVLADQARLVKLRESIGLYANKRMYELDVDGRRMYGIISTFAEEPLSMEFLSMTIVRVPDDEVEARRAQQVEEAANRVDQDVDDDE